MDIAALDTGPYSVAPGHPYGTAGDDPNLRAQLESQRLAAATTGPWTVDPKLQIFAFTPVIGPLSIPPGPRWVLTVNQAANAERHGLVAGFSSPRWASLPKDGALSASSGLTNAVLSFPDPTAASRAATEMAAEPETSTAQVLSREVLTVQGSPETVATQTNYEGGYSITDAYTPYKSFVLLQSVLSSADTPIQRTSKSLISGALIAQKALLDRFVPTPAAKLAELPLDPSGALLSRTLGSPSPGLPVDVGVWLPQAWLHFESDPLTASAMFDAAGVDWVAQLLATVYRTRSSEAATTMLDGVVKMIAKTATASPAAAVPGWPDAKCFKREWSPYEGRLNETQKSIDWHFKCAASMDRYVFTVYADDEKDAQQRIAAQYRILAGR